MDVFCPRGNALPIILTNGPERNQKPILVGSAIHTEGESLSSRRFTRVHCDNGTTALIKGLNFIQWKEIRFRSSGIPAVLGVVPESGTHLELESGV